MMNIHGFQYFMNNYVDLMQMSVSDNLKFFCETEPSQSKEELLKECQLINDNLQLEDWELDKTVAQLCNKYSKRYIKKVVQEIEKVLN